MKKNSNFHSQDGNDRGKGKNEVRQRFRKDLLLGCAAFIAVFSVLSILTTWLSPADQVLSRIRPDFSVNDGYIDPEDLEKQTWTTLNQTSYENGVETAHTVFKRTLFGDYAITHTAADGQTTKLIGQVASDHERREYLGETEENNLYLTSRYENDLLGRIDNVVIRGGSAYPHWEEGEAISSIEIENSEVVPEYIRRQVKYEYPNIVTGYRSMDYKDHKVGATQDYDADGNLLGYEEYTYTDTTRTVTAYDAEGNVIGTAKTNYDWFGRITQRETFDAQGNITGSEVYHYRFWERYFSLEGLLAFIVTASVSATVGGEIFRDRRRKCRAEASVDINAQDSAQDSGRSSEISD